MVVLLVVVLIVIVLIAGTADGFLCGRRTSLLPQKGLQLPGSTRARAASTVPQDDSLLYRALKGETVHRPPVWMLRQAGRYMKSFREYSDKYSFKQRSENPDIATELSLQPWREFGTDGVIMFSDILTLLPAMGIDFNIIPGIGPVIRNPVKSMVDVMNICPFTNINDQLPFMSKLLNNLHQETANKTTLIGFVGAPFTLAAYAIVGGTTKNSELGGFSKVKKMMMNDPVLMHTLLAKLTESICTYASQQHQCGAQVIQLFDSWIHYLTEQEYVEFVHPYVSVILHFLNKYHPDLPVVYFANGGSAFVHRLKETVLLQSDSISSIDNSQECCHGSRCSTTSCGCKSDGSTTCGCSDSPTSDSQSVGCGCKGSEPKSCCSSSSSSSGSSCCKTKESASHLNSLFLDQRIDIASARAIVGKEITISGNVDPLLLQFAANKDQIVQHVTSCAIAGIGRSISNGIGRHVLSVGHGIEQSTPEENVRVFVEAAKSCVYDKL